LINVLQHFDSFLIELVAQNIESIQNATFFKMLLNFPKKLMTHELIDLSGFLS